MDPSEFEIRLKCLSSEEEVVNHILNPDSKIDQGNVTKVQEELVKVFDSDKKSANGLHSIKDNLERIRVFKDRWLDKLKSVLNKELLSTNQWLDLLSKNEAVADLFRKRGNEYFMKRDFDMAFRAYTLAAMYSPKDSKSLALSYSNRSACFFETNRWKKCLEDIKRFEEIWNKIEGLNPTGDKVAKRKEKCFKEIRDKKEEISIEKKFGSTFFKLKKPSAVLPSIEDFLEVKRNPKTGRGIYNVGDETIEPGTLLVLDKSYAHVHRHSICFQTKNCSFCYRLLDGSGIPCGGCVFNLYCSEACVTSDYHNIHSKYECKMAPYLYEVIPKSMESESSCDTHLALSVLLRLGPQGLLGHYRQVFNKKGGEDGNKDESAFSSYLPIYNLIYHEEILSDKKILEHSKYAVVLTEILDFSTDYFTCLNLDELEVKLIKEEFARRLLLHQMTMAVNGNKMDLSFGAQSKLRDLSLGIYPAVSLLNHSCISNARWLPLPDGLFAVIAVEYIIPGQEILANYGHSFISESTYERREDLMRVFGFKCECPACKGNWTLANSKKASQTLGTGCICPDCRKKFEVFNKIHLDHVPLKNLYVCPRKCGFQILNDHLLGTFNHNSILGRGVNKCIDENKILKGFMDAKKCLQYFDAHFPKPNQQILLSVETMLRLLALIAHRMFE